MNETSIEKLALAVMAAYLLIVSGAVLVGTLWLLMIVGSLAGVPPAFAQTPSAGVQLEAGIAKEEVDGDLQSAMEVYRGIATDSSAPRDMRAKALLRLAGCYEKLGRQARQVYEQIVRDFADQPAAAQARSRLTALSQRERLNLPKTMSVRKIETNELISFFPTDTDGQRAVYESMNGKVSKYGPQSDLYFGDLTGHTRRLVFKGMNVNTGWIPSRDLSMVVLFFREPPAPVRVAVINTDGTGYRELLRDDYPGSLYGENGIPFQCCRLSWDNRYLPVAINSLKSGGRLLVVSVADGKRRELRSLETGQFVDAVFSPDGRFVAYETAPEPDQVDSSRVFVVPAQGGPERLVYESEPKPRHPLLPDERVALMDWTADGRYLLIADASYGMSGLYLYPIKNGVAEGTPVLVRSGDFRQGQSRPDGAFIYWDTSTGGNAEFHLASLDAEGRPGNWRRVDLRRGGNELTTQPSFSPDGQSIALVQKPGTLVLHNLSTGQERELYRSDAELLRCHYASHVPKVFCSEQKARETDLLAIAVESGEVERLGSVAAVGYLIRSSHDDQALYLTKSNPMEIPEYAPLVRWELATRRETVVATHPPDFVGFDRPSPDDRWVLRFTPQDFSVRAMSGGDWRSLAASFRSPSFGVAITPDGNWLLYHDTDMAGRPGLFRVPITGRQPQRVGEFPGNSVAGPLAISPDGREILAVTLGSNRDELWVLEHFVPSGK